MRFLQSADFTYLYNSQKNNAVRQIGNTSYSYDLNGNPTLIEGDSVYREMVWNEENRLMLLSDDGEATRYTYDYAGNCAIKSHGPMTSVYINGALQGVDYHDDSDYTLYVSPFMTVNAYRFTKYYYAGTQRVAGKIGNGKFENIYGEDGFHLTAGQKDYAQRAVNTLEGLQDYYKRTGVTPGVPNQLGKTADPYVSGTAYPNVAVGNYAVPDGWPGKVVKHGKGEVPGPPVWFEEEGVQEAVAGVGYQSDNQEEKDVFFYHTDHLQSTTYLTDSAGNICQFLWYAPYGEALIDEHIGSYESPYKFSGKELDENTGLYDHGARHREPASGVWYGVDALFEKYPEVGPFHYCHANPVRLMDLNGMFDTEDEAVFFMFINDLNARTCHRPDGSLEIYDGNTRFTYYHDLDGMLHTEIPEVSVSAVRPAQVESPTLLDHIANGLATADECTNDVARPVISGLVLFNPLLGTFNSAYTIFMGEDIYGNKASTTDYLISSVDILTLGMGRFSCLEPVKNMIDMTGFLCSSYSFVNTVNLEYGKNDK